MWVYPPLPGFPWYWACLDPNSLLCLSVSVSYLRLSAAVYITQSPPGVLYIPCLEVRGCTAHVGNEGSSDQQATRVIALHVSTVKVAVNVHVTLDENKKIYLQLAKELVFHTQEFSDLLY